MTLSRTIIVATLILVIAGSAMAQALQPLYVIDKPTAGILPDRSYNLRGRTGPESSFLIDARVGFFDRFQFGMSYGMQRLFDHGSVEFNDIPGFNARVRLLDESSFPALAIGFDNQGLGFYHKDLKRYDRKSLGLYGVLSKNWALVFGELSFHGGGNYSFERHDDDNVNAFAGVDWLLFQRLSFLLDADAGLNDNSSESFGEGGIYLDGAIRYHFGESIVATLIFRDLTGNFGPQRKVGRELELAFVNFF